MALPMQKTGPELFSGVFNPTNLGGACNHVFDEVSVSWGINDGHIVLAGLEFP